MAPFLAPSKKGFPLLFPLAKKKIYLNIQLKESLLIGFENCQGVPNSYRQSRNRMMNTFIIVKITPMCRDSLEDKSMFVHSKKVFLLLSVWLGKKYTCSLIWKKSLLIYFESCQGIPYSHTGRVDRDGERFTNG